MTFSLFGLGQRAATRTRPAVPRPHVKTMSVVVAVRDNPKGVARLAQWWLGLGAGARPRELLVVDDGSRVPLRVMADGVRVLRTHGHGAAAARNAGWRAASGEWIAFTDSDCLPDPGWPAAFAWGWQDDIAAQGRVRPMRDDALSLFYDSQRILRPMVWTPDARPAYLVTANALVWRDALASVGGFDEGYPGAAGEDVDLGLRLSHLGQLRWCDEASVAHEFEGSVLAFVRRFLRYGRGNRLLSSKVPPPTGSGFRPRPFRPRSGTLKNHALAALAFACLGVGWVLEGRRQ